MVDDKKNATELAAEQAEREKKNQEANAEEQKKRADDLAARQALKDQEGAKRIGESWRRLVKEAMDHDGTRFVVLAEVRSFGDMPPVLKDFVAEVSHAKFEVMLASGVEIDGPLGRGGDLVTYAGHAASQAKSADPTQVHFSYQPNKGGGHVSLRGWYPGAQNVPTVTNGQSTYSVRWLIVRWQTP